MEEFASLPIKMLIRPEGYDCPCGRHHFMRMDDLSIRPGAVQDIPRALSKMGCRLPFVVCDENTKAAAWERVKAVLDGAGISYRLFCFPQGKTEPDERAMGALAMALDPRCDCVMGVGSGVINDCCKVLARLTGRKQIIVGTAPSMDGYASNSSAMLCGGIKTTLFNACPDAVICDIDIMKNAPMRMLWAGLGDMLAKYSALCEWRVFHIVNDEYYCGEVAALMRRSLQKIVEQAPKIRDRDAEAVQAVAEGLVLSGIAMSFAVISRPASGQEHYFSHMWEMMALERKTPADLHGIQVGVGTLLTLGLYDRLKKTRPDREKAERFMREFSDEAWQRQTREIFGSAADALIEREHTLWHKNAPENHERRLERITNRWDEILSVMEELPSAAQTEALMRQAGMPVTPGEIGIPRKDVKNALIGSRSSRDKYLLSDVLWDLGLLQEFADSL